MLFFSIPIFVLLVVYTVFCSRQAISCEVEWAISAVIIAITLLAARGENERSSRRILLYGCCVGGVRYIIWRICCSINNFGLADIICCYALLAAEAFYVVNIAFTTFLHWPGPKDDLAKPIEPSELENPPTLDIFIPTLREPTDILRRTIAGALSVSYPNKKVYVLDDGARPAVEMLAKSMGCHYITRDNRKSAKAGNINNALRQTDGELILTLDADHIAAENIIKYALPLLEDPKVWGVQFAQRFLNPAPVERNLKCGGKVATELQAFFEVLLPALNSWDAAFWAGSGAVIKRSALEEIGGVAEGTVVEDKHTSFRLNQKGYRLAYIATPQVLALNPETLRAYMMQQKRWFIGTFQLIKAFNPIFAKGLTVPHKLCCCLDIYSYFSFFPRIVCALVPALFLLFYICPSRAFVWTYLGTWLPAYGLMLVSTSRVFGKHLPQALSDLYQVLRSPFFVIEFLNTSLKRFGAEFQSTPKGLKLESVGFDARLIAPHALLLLLTVLASIVGTLKLIAGCLDPWPVAVSLAWNIYNAVMLLCCVCCAFDSPEPLEMYGMQTDLPVTVSEVGAGPEYTPIDGKLVYASECGGTIIFNSHQQPPEKQRLEVLAHVNGTSCSLPSRLVSSTSVNGRTTLEVAFSPNDTDLKEVRNFVELTVCGNPNWQKRMISSYGDRKVNSLMLLLRAPMIVAKSVMRAKARGGF